MWTLHYGSPQLQSPVRFYRTDYGENCHASATQPAGTQFCENNSLPFDSKVYSPNVAAILALDQDGDRLLPLVSGVCTSEAAHSLIKKQKPSDLFSKSRSPKAALAGLFLYFSCVPECHELVQNMNSSEGDFWHAILHRQEPDAPNATYWFRQTGTHPVFQNLAAVAEQIAAKYPTAQFRNGAKWDPFFFIEFCGRARSEPGSLTETAALEIQRAEWQLLFDYCARPRS
jgi:hypothetical protein